MYINSLDENIKNRKEFHNNEMKVSFFIVFLKTFLFRKNYLKLQYV
jgi:hypothetical protein